MNKFLLKIGWFIGIVILLNVFYVLLLLQFSPGFKKISELSKFENQKFETIVIGNSMALDGIDAEYLTYKGIPTYNFAIAGCHVSTSLSLFENYLKKNKKPKMVLVGLSSAIGQAYLNPVPYTNPEVEFFIHPNLLSNLTNPPLLNFQWLAVDLLKILISKDHREAKMVLGQWKTKKVIPDQSRLNYLDNTSINYDNAYLNRIIALCEKHKIKLLFIELPGSKNKRNCLPFAKQYKLNNQNEIKIYNLNNYIISESIIDASSDWLSSDHLNQFGSKKLTDYVLKNVINQ